MPTASRLVSRIVQHLISQGFVEAQGPRDLRVQDPLPLALVQWLADRGHGVTPMYDLASHYPFSARRHLPMTSSSSPGGHGLGRYTIEAFATFSKSTWSVLYPLVMITFRPDFSARAR